MNHTGDDASNHKGNFECLHCHRVITMHGNYKDKFPPCPWEKIGTDYIQVATLPASNNGNSN